MAGTAVAVRVGQRSLRKSAILGSAALEVGLFGSTGAWAQCTDTTPLGFGQLFYPLSNGAAIGSIVSTINAANTSFLTTTSAFVSAPGSPRPDQQGGGAWGRTIAGSTDSQSTGITTPTSPILGDPALIGGNITCQSRTRIDYSGFQVGHDISILNSGGSGANWHWGVTAGYFEANAKDRTFGAFSGNIQVPFAGIYTAFTMGNLAIDGQARWDFLKNTISDKTNGLFGQTFDGQGFSLTGNASYNIPLHNKWFVEPSAGVIWSRVQLDPLNVAGTFVLSTSPFFAAPGTVQIGDIESLLGRLSLSVGTTFTSGQVTWQPFFTASLLHEFKGDVVTNIQTHFDAIGIFGVDSTATQTTSRVGTYGQFALGTAAVLGNTGWLGYGRVDYRIGENIEGWSVNAGLRYQFTPPASRSSIKDGPAPALWDTYNWTGAYVGASAGRIWGREYWVFRDPPNTTVDPDFGGYLFGGQAGYNIQMGRIVVGVEGDYGFSNAKGGKSCPNGFFFTCEAEADQLASITARLGYAWGRALFYAKGGWAGGEVTAGTFQNTGGNPLLFITLSPVTSTSHWANGWTLGGGMEFALTDRWSAKAEYMHYDLGKEAFTTFIAPPLTGIADADTRGDIVRVGINYHFGSRCCEAPLK
jgi:opacity protein-like surface antigen